MMFCRNAELFAARTRLLFLIYCLACTAHAAEPVTAREQLNAALWMQSATEYRALTQQVYTQATHRLTSLRKSKGTASAEQAALGNYASKPPAVVLDIDETVLDNLPFNTALLKTGQGFDPAAWDNWVMSAQANALPGAAEFIRKARQLDYHVIFISNRRCNASSGYDAHGNSTDCPQSRVTLKNLSTVLGYSVAANDLLLRHARRDRDDSDKQARRREVAQHFRIVMLLGDDLNDFIRRSDYRSNRDAQLWGNRWFILPNPLYGSWQQAYPDLSHKYAALLGNEPHVTPHTEALTIVSWNLQWLADPQALAQHNFWQKCAAQHWSNEKLRADLPVCDAYRRAGIRTAEEYITLKLLPLRHALATLAQQQVQILAVQEIQNPAALQAILPAGYHVACVTTRDDAQNLGFMVRDDSRWQFSCAEVKPLSLEQDQAIPRAVRRGLALTVAQHDVSFVILNVHLKSGCPQGRMDKTGNANCKSLQQQAAPLEHWSEQQADHARPFMIVGDWNRDLDAEVFHHYPARSDNSDPAAPITNPNHIRNLFPEINDGVPAASAMQLIQVDRSAASESHCHANLDQLVLSDNLLTQLAPGSLHDGQPPTALRALAAGATDHCALHTRLLFERMTTN